MNRRLAVTLLAFAPVALAALPAAAINTSDTRLLSQPVISRTHVAFVYAGDLWVADHDGRNVRRLTSIQGVSNPAFSPDGSLLAFTASYEGNADVYVVPAGGGVPTRLTWHPGRDVVQSFTPDGAAVLFTSARATFTGRYTQLFTVPVRGGVETALPIPNAFRATYSPDGKRLAYNPLYDAFTQWKHYRGGTVSTLWLYQTGTHAVEKIPQPPDRANDVYPMWIGDLVYFVSDRAGEFNLFSYDTKTKAVRQLTSYDDFPILSASAGGGRIVFERAGYLHLFDPASGRASRMTIGVAADLADVRPRFAKGARWIRAAALSPTGARAAFEFRGEIVTVPAEKGDPRNLTGTPGVHERSPIWSPDGTRIAWFSDASGEYQLVVELQDGKGSPRSYALGGAGFYGRPAWSPDGKKIAFTDNSWSLFWIDLDTGAVKKVASEPVYGLVGTLAPAWSPDSRWIVYTLNTPNYFQTVYAHSLDRGTSVALTDGLSEVTEPVFDRSGKYLFFFGSTDAGPVKDWFAMSNADMEATRSIYLMVLPKDLPSPLAKESDEEKAAEAGKKEAPKDAAKEPEPVRIDIDGLGNRILAVPLPAGDYSALRAGEAGQLYYLAAAEGKSALHHYDLNTRKDEILHPDVTSYMLSGDGKKLGYRSGQTWAIGPTKGKIDPSQGRLNVDAIDVKIDPVSEWTQIFDEAWRINRDYFYAPNMHGVDWSAMKKKYAVFLPDLAVRDDLNRVIQWMCSELGVGHHRVGGGDARGEATAVPGGLLGADYTVENGRYRFKKIYGGLNWNPELRSPLTEPGVDVRAGEYLLAVNGVDLRPPANLYRPFENTSGRIVEITVGPDPDGTGARTVRVVPIASEAALRSRDWVEVNLKKVQEATGGRVAYVYVPNTSTQGHAYFKRYFYPQAHKEAIIVDERFNGGGLVADYYIDLLRRPLGAWWAMRYGADLRTPTASIQGPKVMIIDETAGSGGDFLPWMWRKFQMGPLVGKRTWGGLVGTLGFPVLMDGGGVTAPNLAIWSEEGWVVENIGVPPDIEVEQTPAEVIAGRDPQLDRAIQVVLDELKKSPPKTPVRPPHRDIRKEIRK